MDVQWIPGGLLGFVKDPDGKLQEGVALALRKGGDEVLFGHRAEKPCAWVLVTDFFVDPAAMPEIEEIQGDEDGPDEIPQPAGPFGVRRRQETE